MWTNFNDESGGINPWVFVIVAVLVVGGLAFLGFSIGKSGNAYGNSGFKDSLNAQIKDQQNQLSLADSQVKSLEEKLSKTDSEKANLQDQVLSANVKVLGMNDQISSLRTQITALDNQIAILQTKTDMIPGLEKQSSDLTNQLEQANKQISSFMGSTGLTKSSTEMFAENIDVPAGAVPIIHEMTVNSAGYLQISAAPSTINSFFKVKDTFTGYPYNDNLYMLDAGGTLIIPILPGNITIYYGNAKPGEGVSAVVTIKYYY
jgi:hypothetical protein